MILRPRILFFKLLSIQSVTFSSTGNDGAESSVDSSGTSRPGVWKNSFFSKLRAINRDTPLPSVTTANNYCRAPYPLRRYAICRRPLRHCTRTKCATAGGQVLHKDHKDTAVDLVYRCCRRKIR